MKKFLFTVWIIVIVIDSFGQSTAKFVKDQLIIKFKKEVNFQLSGRQEDANQTGVLAFDQLNQLNQCKTVEYAFKGEPSGNLNTILLLTFHQEKDIVSMIEQYDSTGLFEYVQPNYLGHLDGAENVNVTPNEPAANFKNQWGLYNDGSFDKANGKIAKKGADINIMPAWDITTGDSNTVVAIIDGGLNLTHPEFSGRIWKNTKEIEGNGKDDDQNGFIDDVNGWNFSANNNKVSDEHGHGSNVTSIIGATGNNSTGWVGVNWKCKLMVISNGSGSFSSSVIINAIKYAADNGAKVVNMSLGFTGVSSDPAMQDAINYAYAKKVLLVASMGNNNTGNPQTPACLKNVMAVGATNVDDSRCVPFGKGGSNAEGSNYGAYISVVAPGNWIVGCTHTSPDDYTVYNSYNGTSQSTPFVTGVASLMFAVNPNLSPGKVREIIEKTAADQVGKASEDVKGWDKYMGWGRLDAYKAVKEAQLSTDVKQGLTYSNECRFYPNPFNGTGFLSFDTAPGMHHTIFIYDAFGKEIKQIRSEKRIVEISADGMMDGIYFYHVLAEDGTHQHGKMIVRQ